MLPGWRSLALGFSSEEEPLGFAGGVGLKMIDIRPPP